MTASRTAISVGWREVVCLPDLGIPEIKAKIDTGARTSALHSETLHIYDQDGEDWVDFKVPITNTTQTFQCRAKLLDRREIKNTSGIPEERLVVETTLRMGNEEWPIELSLADREAMKFDLILGRSALKSANLIVDPKRSFLTQNS